MKSQVKIELRLREIELTREKGGAQSETKRVKGECFY